MFNCPHLHIAWTMHNFWHTSMPCFWTCPLTSLLSAVLKYKVTHLACRQQTVLSLWKTKSCFLNHSCFLTLSANIMKNRLLKSTAQISFFIFKDVWCVRRPPFCCEMHSRWRHHSLMPDACECETSLRLAAYQVPKSLLLAVQQLSSLLSTHCCRQLAQPGQTGFAQ